MIFSPLFTKGGHSKNFLNLIKHIEPEIKNVSYTPNIISFNNTSFEKTDNIIKISETAYLNSYKVRFFKRFFPSGNALFQIAELVLNFTKTIIYMLIIKPDIVYAYSDKTLFLVHRLKKLFNFKLIYDLRGDYLDELKAQRASKRLVSIFSKMHSKALNSVDLTFSVSNVYKIKSNSKFIPKYNYYDGDMFRYNETNMLNKRKEMKLENKFVFVYTGNAHYYQFLEGTINFFSQFLNQHNDSFLIILTEYDFTEFNNLLNYYNIPESNCMLKSLPQNEISELQQVADMGFLMRENLPLNHHSFPTKFAEYLASGVPVLMTPHIHSIAPIVNENNLGEVIDIKNNYSAEIEKIYSKYKRNLSIKKHCSEYADKELMWQKKSTDIFNNIIRI